MNIIEDINNEEEQFIIIINNSLYMKTIYLKIIINVLLSIFSNRNNVSILLYNPLVKFYKGVDILKKITNKGNSNHKRVFQKLSTYPFLDNTNILYITAPIFNNIDKFCIKNIMNKIKEIKTTNNIKFNTILLHNTHNKNMELFESIGTVSVVNNSNDIHHNMIRLYMNAVKTKKKFMNDNIEFYKIKDKVLGLVDYKSDRCNSLFLDLIALYNNKNVDVDSIINKLLLILNNNNFNIVVNMCKVLIDKVRCKETLLYYILMLYVNNEQVYIKNIENYNVQSFITDDNVKHIIDDNDMLCMCFEIKNDKCISHGNIITFNTYNLILKIDIDYHIFNKIKKYNSVVPLYISKKHYNNYKFVKNSLLINKVLLCIYEYILDHNVYHTDNIYRFIKKHYEFENYEEFRYNILQKLINIHLFKSRVNPYSMKNLFKKWIIDYYTNVHKTTFDIYNRVFGIKHYNILFKRYDIMVSRWVTNMDRFRDFSYIYKQLYKNITINSDIKYILKIFNKQILRLMRLSYDIIKKYIYDNKGDDDYLRYFGIYTVDDINSLILPDDINHVTIYAKYTINLWTSQLMEKHNIRIDNEHMKTIDSTQSLKIKKSLLIGVNHRKI